MSRLVEFRKAARLTQLELAKLVGVSQGAITHLETGRTKSPEFKTIRTLVRVLNDRGVDCTAEEIFPASEEAA